MSKQYLTSTQVYEKGKEIVNRSLRDFVNEEKAIAIEKRLVEYKNNRKGYLGELIEEYLFGLSRNSRSEADFNIAGVELKTTPLKKHPKKLYVAKERLVFSMIDYDKIVKERWETSSFLEKNKLLLLMFYLYAKEHSILDYEFKFVHLLDLLRDISVNDIEQIRKDWEFIVEKIRRGEAHLLSEGDTYYLGACTKAKDSSVVRDQPRSRIPAKPRAFSLKQTYLNYLIQTKLLHRSEKAAISFYSDKKLKGSIEDIVLEKFTPFFGKTDEEIAKKFSVDISSNPKNLKRILANYILTGSGGNKAEELEKANVVVKVVTLEAGGGLKESLSFPAFDYKELIEQEWYNGKKETLADFHSLLDSQKFLFVVFQKIENSKRVILKKIKFWNFPASDLLEVEKVFEKTVAAIRSGNYAALPKLSENEVAHVRPHGRDASDTLMTPQGTQEIKRCFWLNAKYIQKILEN